MTFPTEQQRLIVKELAEHTVPISARVIAEATRVPTGSVSAQLSRLLKSGFVSQCEAGWELTKEGKEYLSKEPSKGPIDEQTIGAFAKEFVSILTRLKGKGDMELKLNVHKDGKISIYIGFDDMK